VIRLYELKAAAAFEMADFVSLFEKDQSVLAADLIARDELVLRPGESTSLRRPTSDARFFGVMAAFRDLERAHWRAVMPLTPGADNAFALSLDVSALKLQRT